MNKEEKLRSSNTYNSKSSRVNAPCFADNEMMDPHDLLQVRYEMVRAIELDNKSIKDTCSEFGVSASTARRYVRDLKEGGLIALVPEKKGPAGPTRLSKEAAEFIDNYLKEFPKASGGKVHRALETKLHTGVSKRTVERYLLKKG